ncbi:hypothetical protein BC832DRAFT_569298 [Gaertneriomyces semiglobifer]|nr:hypothetical protein BC832DRAFT_569298 [Gaertneriomyces semiglobifer]
MVKLEEITKDGVGVVPIQGVNLRKGTFLCAMMNCWQFNELEQKGTPSQDEQIQKILTDLQEFMPSLIVSRLFRFFLPLEWIRNGSHGRIMMLAVYLSTQEGRKDLTPEVKKALKEVYDNEDSTDTFKEALVQAIGSEGVSTDWLKV